MAKAKNIHELELELKAAEKEGRIEKLKARKRRIEEDIKARKGIIEQSHKEQDRLKDLLRKLTGIVESDEFNPIRRPQR